MPTRAPATPPKTPVPRFLGPAVPTSSARAAGRADARGRHAAAPEGRTPTEADSGSFRKVLGRKGREGDGKQAEAAEGALPGTSLGATTAAGSDGLPARADGASGGSGRGAVPAAPVVIQSASEARDLFFARALLELPNGHVIRIETRGRREIALGSDDEGTKALLERVRGRLGARGFDCRDLPEPRD